MARLHLLLATATLVVLTQSSSAHAEQPIEPPVAASPPNVAASVKEEGPMLPGGIMRVLDALVVVGVAEIDKSSALISHASPTSTAQLPVRAPTWSAPEPPKTPLFYSRVVQLKFW
jgi:hypothetical protein